MPPDHPFNIGLTDQGTILLGSKVCCDGYSAAFGVRVQTHWHEDHMKKFGKSKGRGEILMTQGTFDLLETKHPDLAFRLGSNVHVIPKDEDYEIDGEKIRLQASEHCLGGAQVLVELEDGTRMGYSSDFSWPLESVIEVDALVLDATYGNTENVINYTQADAETALTELVHNELLAGRSVHLIAKGGVTERALGVLRENDILEDTPVLGGEKLFFSQQVHVRHGYTMPPVENHASSAGIAYMEGARTRPYLRCWSGGSGTQLPNDAVAGTRISLGKFGATEVIQDEGAGYRVGFSNHADNNETIEYARRTGASFILTDGTRSRLGARRLALILQDELGVQAEAFQSTETIPL